jgi:hypothetical protein
MITTLTRQVVKRCPYKDETDAGELVIVIDGDVPELHELGRQVDELSAGRITHEDFTSDVAALLPGAQVTTRWKTGPWSVEVSISAVPR